MSRVTGHIISVDRAAGPVLYMKARDREGKQKKRVLGPAAEWTNGKGKPSKQANDRLRAFLVELGQAPSAPVQKVTLGHVADAWLRWVEHERERKPSTVRDYRNTIGQAVEHFGALQPVVKITTDDVDAYRLELLERVSRRTAQKTLVLLHQMFKFAKRRRWVAENPVENAERVTVRRRTEFAVLSPAEVAAVARAARVVDSDDDAQATTAVVGAAITVSAFTGLRMGELRALRWRDVDFTNRIIHVRRSVWRTEEGTTKSSRARSVPLIDQAAVALDALSRREHYTDPGDLVFGTEYGGKLHDNELRKGLYKAMKAAGISRDRGTGKPFVWHDLRHSFGTLAVQAFPLSDVQHFLGHADVTTTAIYLHHVPQVDAADRFSAVVAKALGTLCADPREGSGTETGTELSESEVTSGV